VLLPAVAGGVAWATLQIFGNLFDLDVAIEVFLHGAIAGIAGIACSVLFLYFSRNREFFEITERLK
jgi:Zn-dependent protease with chaperone function